MSGVVDDMTSSLSYGDSSMHARVRFHRRKPTSSSKPSSLTSSIQEDPLDQQPIFNYVPCYILFFLLGLAMPISYSSITFKLFFFEECIGYGDAFYATCFAAYNMPAMPVFYLQYRWDRGFDLKFGTARATIARTVVCVFMMLVPVMVLPYIDASYVWLAATLAIGGIANGALFSTLCTLAGCFNPKTQIFLLTGAGSATFILLLVNILLEEDICNDVDFTVSRTHREIFFGTPAALTGLAIVWVLILMRLPVGKYSTDMRDVDLRASVAAEAASSDKPDELALSRATAPSGRQPLLDLDGDSESPRLVTSSSIDSNASAPGAGKMSLGEIAWTARWALLLAVVVYFPTYVTQSMYPTYKRQNDFVKKNMFYLEAGAAFFGRQLNLLLSRFSNAFVFFIIALIRSSVGVTMWFLGTDKDFPTNSESVPFLILLCAWGLSHGLLGTLPYRLADQCFVSAADKKQIGVLLQVAITVCVYLTSVFSFFILPSILP